MPLLIFQFEFFILNFYASVNFLFFILKFSFLIFMPLLIFYFYLDIRIVNRGFWFAPSRE